MITQNHGNYQESVNTLLFGSKAKTIKTQANVNEIQEGSPELLQALQEI
jgi:hypothetical protein